MLSNFIIFNEQTALLEYIHTLVYMLLTVLLECFMKMIVLLEYISMTNGKDFLPCCNSLPIMLALCLMLSST